MVAVNTKDLCVFSWQRVYRTQLTDLKPRLKIVLAERKARKAPLTGDQHEASLDFHGQ